MLKKHWKLLIHNNKTGSQNMRYDQGQWENFDANLSPPVLRVFSFSPNCITYGYNQNIDEIIDTNVAKQCQWQIAKRPTGGGILFHTPDDLSFSIIVNINDLGVYFRKPKEVFKKIAPIIRNSLMHLPIKLDINSENNKSNKNDYCFNYASQYEINYSDKKVFGFAQRQDKQKILIQGSLFVGTLPKEAHKILIYPKEEYHSISLSEIIKPPIKIDDWAEKLKQSFERELNIAIV